MSLPAAQLLAELTARGVTVRADGEILRVRPASACADLLADVRERKAELLRIVHRPRTFYPGQPHLEKLAHCIGATVSTPHGDGVLLAVREQGPCFVRLDASPTVLAFVPWRDISPPATEQP